MGRIVGGVVVLLLGVFCLIGSIPKGDVGPMFIGLLLAAGGVHMIQLGRKKGATSDSSANKSPET